MSADKTALEIQTKFAFYLVALVFTILALGIQTAEFGASTCHSVIELSAWLVLLVSGLSGLRRIEIMPRIISIGGTETNSKESRELKEEALHNKQATALKYYKVHVWSFVIGIMLIIISRAYYGLSTASP